MFNGLLSLPWWGYLIITLVFTHITIVCVTLYLHRHQAHHAINLHPVVSHFFRFWLWLTTGMDTKEWVAIHRKHHAKVEKEQDPHSPQVYGINKVLWDGVDLYRKESHNQQTLEEYGHGTPDDWMERNIYIPYSWWGIGLMLFINFILFGFLGLTIWAIQMAWIPFFAAGVINGIGHYWGYRNFDSPDASTNIIPLGILIGGEEMHNNHHAFASSARFSSKWWEFDIGWLYIQILKILNLARVNKVAPRPKINLYKQQIDTDTVEAVISNRLHIMSVYAKQVIAQVYNEEHKRTPVEKRPILKRLKQMLNVPQMSVDPLHQKHLQELLENNDALKKVYEFRQQLQAIWQEKSASYEKLIHDLQEWCKQAEQSGIKSLEEFAQTIRFYSLAT